MHADSPATSPANHRCARLARRPPSRRTPSPGTGFAARNRFRVSQGRGTPMRTAAAVLPRARAGRGGILARWDRLALYGAAACSFPPRAYVSSTKPVEKSCADGGATRYRLLEPLPLLYWSRSSIFGNALDERPHGSLGRIVLSDT